MIFYFVQKEETLYAIARRYQTTVHAIVTANRLKDPNAVSAGQALVIPPPGEQPSPPPGGVVHLVRPGETIFTMATQYRVSPIVILRTNQIAHPEFLLPGHQVVIPECNEVDEDWPMLGRTSGRRGAGPVVLKGTPTAQWELIPAAAGRAQPSAPVIRYGRVFVGLGDGNYYCLDRHDGRVKWRHRSGESGLPEQDDVWGLATPVILDGLAYLCGADGWVEAVDAYTARRIWRLSLKSPVTSTPTTYEDLLLCGSWDGLISAVEIKTGAIAWKRQLSGGLKHPLAVSDGRLIALTEDGSVWAIDSTTGELCWTVPTELHTPVCAPNRVIIGGSAYDSATGQMLWAMDTQHVPVIQSEQVIYPEAVVSLETGRIQRRFAWPSAAECMDGSPSSALTSYITPVEPHQMVSTASGSWFLTIQGNCLYAWDLADGSLLWEQALPTTGLQPPAVTSDQIAVTLVDGGIRSYRLEVPVEPE